LIPRPWIDHPYGEEEITLLEEELMPAMAMFLARVEVIDRAIEADQELEVAAHQARSGPGRLWPAFFAAPSERIRPAVVVMAVSGAAPPAEAVQSPSD
jgi:hypothetical protein